MTDHGDFSVSNDDLVREGVDTTHYMGQELLRKQLPHLYGGEAPEPAGSGDEPRADTPS